MEKLLKQLYNNLRENYENATVSFLLAVIIGFGMGIIFYTPLVILIAIATKIGLVSVTFFEWLIDEKTMMMTWIAFGLGFVFAKRKDMRKFL